MGLMMLGGYHSFGPGGFRDSPLADVLPINIGPAQRQSFGEPLREDVHLPGPVRMRPAAPLGTRHPIMQLEVAAGVGVRRAKASRRYAAERLGAAAAARRREPVSSAAS